MTALVATAPAIARATIAHHSKSFALATRLLGKQLGDRTAIVYTWCRRADDAIDLHPETGELALVRLAAELDDVYAGRARDPVLAAFGHVVHERNIPKAYPAELLAGMAMDVRGAHYATIDDLIEYAWRVAGVVGVMMAHVFGVTDDDALVHAAHLGIAMQLTNICRDVAEDWHRGRLYLPAELLDANGGLASSPAVAATIEQLLALADRYYRSGDRGMRALPRRAALGVRAARRVYSAIGGRIERTGFDVTAGRVHVSASAKLAHIAAAALRTAMSRRRRVHVPTRILELRDVPRL